MLYLIALLLDDLHVLDDLALHAKPCFTCQSRLDNHSHPQHNRLSVAALHLKYCNTTKQRNGSCTCDTTATNLLRGIPKFRVSSTRNGEAFDIEEPLLHETAKLLISRLRPFHVEGGRIFGPTPLGLQGFNT